MSAMPLQYELPAEAAVDALSTAAAAYLADASTSESSLLNSHSGTSTFRHVMVCTGNGTNHSSRSAGRAVGSYGWIAHLPTDQLQQLHNVSSHGESGWQSRPFVVGASAGPSAASPPCSQPSSCAVAAQVNRLHAPCMSPAIWHTLLQPSAAILEPQSVPALDREKLAHEDVEQTSFEQTWPRSAGSKHAADMDVLASAAAAAAAPSPKQLVKHQMHSSHASAAVTAAVALQAISTYTPPSATTKFASHAAAMRAVGVATCPAAAGAHEEPRAVIVAKIMTKSDAATRRIILPRLTVEANLPLAVGQPSYKFPVTDACGCSWHFVIRPWSNGPNPKPVYVLEHISDFMKEYHICAGDVVGLCQTQDGRMLVEVNTDSVRSAVGRPTYSVFALQQQAVGTGTRDMAALGLSIPHVNGVLLCPRTEGCTRHAGHQGWCSGHKGYKKRERVEEVQPRAPQRHPPHRLQASQAQDPHNMTLSIMQSEKGVASGGRSRSAHSRVSSDGGKYDGRSAVNDCSGAGGNGFNNRVYASAAGNSLQRQSESH